MIDERKQLDDRASVGFCKKGFISHIIMCKIYIYMIKKVATILQRNKKKRLWMEKKWNTIIAPHQESNQLLKLKSTF